MTVAVLAATFGFGFVADLRSGFLTSQFMWELAPKFGLVAITGFELIALPFVSKVHSFRFLSIRLGIALLVISLIPSAWFAIVPSAHEGVVTTIGKEAVYNIPVVCAVTGALVARFLCTSNTYSPSTLAELHQ